ncbi:MAG: deoxyribonuclease IV [Elusimicrobia bacterium]|nr:deoxyribonuclease IV [Elusimicrobiota bacterium]
MILGVHASVRRGYDAALEEARSVGCAALQILPYARHHEPTAQELSSFRAARRGAGVDALLVHSRYAPSLASADAPRRARSVAHLARELSLTMALGADAYVIHGGAYSPGSSLEEGVRLFADSVIRAVETAGFPAPVLVENVPGGGRRMGGGLEELARLLEALAPRAPSVGACLDTAHAWAAGYDLSSIEGALKFLSKAHRLLGPDAVRAFHLNDSSALLGSHREHHEHWGKGRLGREGLKALLERPEFESAPAILETHKDGPGADRANLSFARGLL